MAYQPLSRVLSSTDLFSGLPDNVLNDLAAAGSTHTTPPGGTVVVQGSSDAGLQVVLEGSASVDVSGVARPEILPGGYFGEVSLIDGLGRSATLTAGPDGLKTWAISALSFSPLIDKHPALARALLKTLAARVRELDKSSQD
jgi:CRP/FNR family transcriptional regulator, cyclic AMP receptor protein